jgi:hypothetical protein
LPKHIGKRGVILSFEVAEHLPASLADRFLDLLIAASDLLTAATWSCSAPPRPAGAERIT